MVALDLLLTSLVPPCISGLTTGTIVLDSGLDTGSPCPQAPDRPWWDMLQKKKKHSQIKGLPGAKAQSQGSRYCQPE